MSTIELMSGKRSEALVFNGVEIHDRNEMLCLTDMWKAQGSPANMEPYNWERKEGASFIEAVALSHNLPVEQVMTKKRGKSGATWGHWQAGIAYAKYLSHDFHMWANSVVRERMEGKPASAIPGDVVEMIERTNGIVKKLNHKVTLLEKGGHLENVLAHMLPAAVEREMLKGGLHLSREYDPAIDVLKEHKVPPKGRRAFAQRCSAQMRRLSVELGRAPRLSSETGRYLFHVDVIRVWLERGGKALITAHIAAVRGQGVLPFSPRPVA